MNSIGPMNFFRTTDTTDTTDTTIWKPGLIIHDARIPQTTKLILNGARDDTMQCLIKESGLRESNRCQKMIKGKPR